MRAQKRSWRVWSFFMVRLYPFAAVRPERNAAPMIAAVPYDVVTSDEARAIIEKNPQSFLRVSRSDAELSGISPNDARVYLRARDNFLALLADGRMKRDPTPSMYIYRVIHDGNTFLGLTCCFDVDDYRKNRIRRHEQTRYDKEEDRTRHIEATKTHNGPVVLLYRDKGDLFSFIESLVPAGAVPDTEVCMETGAIHQIFRLSDTEVVHQLEDRFSAVPFLYIADGHHRAKSAVNVADRYRGAKPADEINRFLGVMFAQNRVRIHGYSRLLTDIGTHSNESFREGLMKHFDVAVYGHVDGRGFQIAPHIRDPGRYHIFHLYLEGCWYECSRRIDPKESSLRSLDVAVLQDYVLEGMLGITDPRGDARLQYLGGARPVGDLMRLVDSGEYVLAIAMQPVRVETVLDIADAGGVMPPKSTWFEPKLMSGLISFFAPEWYWYDQHCTSQGQP
jgi:uncharacterized protein (DUF1015 family)